MLTDMERLFVIVCALGAASVRSEKIERSVDFNHYSHNYINTNDDYRGINNGESFEITKNRVFTTMRPKVHTRSDRKAELEVYKLLSNPFGKIDMAKLNHLGENLISTANVTEEARRIVRQVKRQRPGFFWTLFRVTFETVSETKSAIQEISNILGRTISPDSTSKAPSTSTLPSNTTLGMNTTSTSTPAPFRLTPMTIASLIRRNFKGLVRLFNIEWKDAIDQSQINIQEFKQALGKSAAPFLADNPNAG